MCMRRIVVSVLLFCCWIQVASASVGSKVLFSTYLGGSGFDEGFAVTTDAAGSVYVAGLTSSPTFPGNNTASSGPDDFFVAKFSAAGQLLYSQRIGGSSFDEAFGIAVDGLGNIYVTGQTGSSDFPIVNGFQTQFGGGFSDAFLVKLNPSGTLVYSSYLGGTGGNESAGAIAVDGFGNAWLAGRTDSVDFPRVNAAQANLGGGADAFVAKVNTNVTGTASLVYSTYLGGFGFESGNAISVDGSGNAYVAGAAAGGFPTTADAFQTTNHGPSFDVFVTKLDAIGGLIYSTLIGGIGSDVARGISTDQLGNVYVTGETSSLDFPTTRVPFQSTNNADASWNAFLVKLNPSIAGTSGLLYSTYLGGQGPDSGSGVIVDSAGRVFVTGYTTSASFPVLDAIQPQIAGGRDAFLIELDPAISGSGALLYGTFLGGGHNDESLGIALASDRRIAITGFTDDGTFPRAGSFQIPYGGSRDAFVAYATLDTIPPSITVPSDALLNATSPAGAVFTFIVSATDDADPNVVASCAFPSGTVFPIGTTLNTCTAADASGNTATASFHVTVEGAAQQISDLEAYVTSLHLASGLTNSLDAKLEAASRDSLPKSCADLNDFIAQVGAQTGKAISSQQSATLRASATRIQAVLGCH
jgi:hypothetical protein